MPPRNRSVRMDLRRLKTFVAVAELGTVTKAAVHLRIGQPALSRQISDLQQELGLRLFDRVGRRLILTAQGKQLLVDCRRVLTNSTVCASVQTCLARRHRRTESLSPAAHDSECAVRISTAICSELFACKC